MPRFGLQAAMVTLLACTAFGGNADLVKLIVTDQAGSKWPVVPGPVAPPARVE